MTQDPYRTRWRDLDARERQAFGAEPLPAGWIAIPMHPDPVGSLIHAAGLGILGVMAGTGIAWILATSDIIGRNREFLADGDHFAAGLGTALILAFVIGTLALLRGSLSGFLAHADTLRQRQAMAAGRMVAGLLLTDDHALFRRAGQATVLKIPRADVQEALTVRRQVSSPNMHGSTTASTVQFLRFAWADRALEIRLTEMAGDPVAAVNAWRLRGGALPPV